MIRILDVIDVINFFIKNAVLNVNILNFSSYLARWMLFNFRKYFLTNVKSLKSSYAS